MQINDIFKTSISSTDTEQNNEYYSLIGEEDFIDNNGNPRISLENNSKIIAKAIYNKPSKHITNNKTYRRFYILTTQNNNLINPLPLASNVKDKEAFSFINNTCKGGAKFKEVTQSIFDKYITFLRTKNLRWLNSAQREMN